MRSLRRAICGASTELRAEPPYAELSAALGAESPYAELRAEPPQSFVQSFCRALVELRAGLPYSAELL